MKSLTTLFTLLVLVSMASADPARAISDLEQREPSIADVRRAALRYAGSGDHPEQSWSLRARLAGALPVVTVRAMRVTDDDQKLSQSSKGDEKLDLDTSDTFTYEARAVWKLDRLVFDEVELRALQAAQRAHRERTQLLLQVTNLYFQRRKLQIAAIVAPEKDPGRAALQALAIAELTAQLDALTGGYLSRTSAQGR